MPSWLKRAAALAVLSPFLPAVLLLRLLRPLKLIRLGRLRQDRIGHLAMNTEYYLCRDEGRALGAVDLFAAGGASANAQLSLMWSRVLPMSRLLWPLWRANELLPGGDAHRVGFGLTSGDYEGVRDLLAATPTHLSFTPEEERRGQAALRAMGVPEGRPFVCFHARDSAFLRATEPSRDWRYHDFRDSDIANFVPAAEELTRRGYAAIRMGAVVAEPLRTNNPLVIDYASKHRSEFMDVYLAGKCRFFIAGNSGIADVAEVFRRPQARTNATQFFAEFLLSGPKDLTIPKRVYREAEGRFLTLAELAASPVWELKRAEQLRSLGLRMEENTAEEILEAVVELEERLRGVWNESPEDEERQRRFWRILKDAGKLTRPPVGRIGAGFLRRHPELLEERASARPRPS